MPQQIQDAYIVSALRTPVGKAKGVFANKRPDDLLADVLRNLLQANPTVDPTTIEDVIIGCAMPEGEQGMNVARISTLLAGLPDSAPAMTVNRFCASGLQAIAMAADKIRLGEADVMIAGGVESMTRIPMGGFHYAANPAWFHKELQSSSFTMGITAEKVAHRWEITREQQDEFAYTSHARAKVAIENEVFAEEIIPIELRERICNPNNHKIFEKVNVVKQDQGPRFDTNLESLAKLRPVFHTKGSVTAGNTSQMSDGAAALLIVSEKAIQQYDLQPIARFCGYEVAGVPPEIMGIGPVKAVPKVLQQAGVQLADVAWIELNEAFAAQSLAVIKDLELDPEKVNPVGGAIALGHPLGATGAIRATTLVHGLRRTKQKYGLVTMCVGTGMGAAGLFEAV